MPGYEFKITLNKEKVMCELETPLGHRRNLGESDIQREQNLGTILVLEQWLKRWEWIAKANDQGESLLVPDTFKVLGDHLWNLALNNNIGNELMKAHNGMADLEDDSREPIRVRISFEQDASDLAALPWEFVRGRGGPEGGFFLAAQTNLVLGRFLGDVKDLGIKASDLKVRVLFVRILPDNFAFKEQRREFEYMLDKLSEIGDAFEIVPISEWNPAEVANRLGELKSEGKAVDVVHVVAVCEEEGRKPKIYLPGYGGGSEWRGQDPQPVVKALTGDIITRPELVVLHLSDQRSSDPPAHFELLAPSFIRAGIPAVLAMQYPMTHPHGQDFVYNFYSRLTRGAAIGEAVQAARHDLSFGRQPNRHFGAPVLYMQSSVDCRLLKMSTATETSYSVVPATGSSPAEPELRRSAPNRSAGIAQVLLEEVDLNSPDASTAGALREWINSVPWPDDLNKAWLILQARRRVKQDHPMQAPMYAQLMGKVSDMIDKERGKR
jgi:hypothetical protein